MIKAKGPSLGRVALGSLAWSAVENGSVTLASFLSLIIFTKLLLPKDFGTFSVALAVIEVAGIFTNMFFHDALVRQENAHEGHFNGAFTLSIGFSIATIVLLYFLFPTLGSLVGDSDVSSVGRVSALALLLSAPSAIVNAWQVRQFQFRLLAVRTLAGRLAGAAIGILVAFLGYGVWALVTQYLLMTAFGSLTLVWFSQWKPRITFEFRPITDLLKYSIQSTTMLAADFFATRAFVFSTGMFLGIDAAGYFNVAFKLIDTAWSISANAISQVLLSLMSQLQSDKARLLRTYEATLLLGCVGLFPIFTGIGVVAPEIVLIMFGSAWINSGHIAFWIGLLVFAQAPQIFSSRLLSVAGHVRIVRSISVTTLFFMIAAISVTRLSNQTIAIAVWSAFQCLGLALHTYYVSRTMNFPISRSLKVLALPLAASCIMAIGVTIVKLNISAAMPPIAQLTLLSSFGAAIYGAIIYIFGRKQLVRVMSTFRDSRESTSPTNNAN